MLGAEEMSAEEGLAKGGAGLSSLLVNKGLTHTCFPLGLVWRFYYGHLPGRTPLQGLGRPRQEQLEISADGKATPEGPGNLIPRVAKVNIS